MDITMEIDEITLKFNQIFTPKILEEHLAVVDENKRFAYYTTAETAIKILEKSELWFRNSTVMNDSSEISYGLELIDNVFTGETGNRFKDAVDSIFSETIKKVSEKLKAWKSDWKHETYIACISIHDDAEDKSGRLSMWRAYGDTAIIVNNAPLIAVTDQLAVFSIPMAYPSKAEYKVRVNSVTEAINDNREYLKKLGQETLVEYIHNMLFLTAIGTKHPGFAEEKEWRLFYRPNQKKSSEMVGKPVVLNGVPQIVYALRLDDDQERGLHSADIPSLINRIIIGPTEYPYVSVEAFISVLKRQGVQDASNKVVASDIPLRPT